MDANTGGAAFPQIETREAWGGSADSGFQVFGDVTSSGGMTLRDYFAAKASEDDVRSFIPETIGGVADLMVSLGWITQRARDGDVTRAYTQDQRRRLRQWARYQHADAMLAARGNR